MKCRKFGEYFPSRILLNGKQKKIKERKFDLRKLTIELVRALEVLGKATAVLGIRVK
jgi:hypothetical protein